MGPEEGTSATGRLGQTRFAVLIAALASLALSACQPIEQNVVLALDDGSDITITAPSGFPPPLTTHLEGSIDSTLTIEIGFFDILFGLPLEGTVAINDILIAGTPVSVIGISTGTLCTLLDPNAPSGGDVTIDLKQGELDLSATAGSTIYATDPTFIALAGSAGIAFPVDVETTVPVNLFDLLGALSGELFPIAFSQEVSFVLPPTLPLIGNAAVEGTLFFASAAEAPTSPALTFCAAFEP